MSREMFQIRIDRVDSVSRPASRKRFALVKDENAALVAVVREVVAEHLGREAFLAELGKAVTNALRPVNRQITALTLSIADVRRTSDARRRRPPPGDERHAYDGNGDVIQCYGEGCHEYNVESGRWVARHRGEGRP